MHSHVYLIHVKILHTADNSFRVKWSSDESPHK
jgi:hypothetical protein